MTFAMPSDPASHGVPVSSVGSATAHCIPQPGGRPITFSGTELAMAMSFTPSLPYWYELNIYRTEEQAFVVAIRLFFQSEEEDDIVSAWSFTTIDEALDHIQNYDAAMDVPVPDIDVSAMAPAEMTAMALQMQARVDAARRHYAGLVGELFCEIETAGAMAA